MAAQHWLTDMTKNHLSQYLTSSSLISHDISIDFDQNVKIHINFCEFFFPTCVNNQDHTHTLIANAK